MPFCKTDFSRRPWIHKAIWQAPRAAISSTASAILTVAFLTSAALCDGPPPDHSTIRSWAALGGDLQKHLSLDETTGVFNFDKSTEFSRILAQNDKSIWFEMLNQRDQPLVVLAGYVCIEKKSPDDAFDCALRAVAGKPRGESSMLIYPMLQFLRRAEPSPAHFKTFALVGKSWGPQDRQGETLAIAGLSYPFLYKWFNDAASNDASWSFRAAVLDRLLGDVKKEAATITPRMQNSLAVGEKIPGFPRLVFLVHTQRVDDQFSTDIFEILPDRSIDDLDVMPLLLNHLPFVRQHADELRKLPLNEARKKSVEHAIKFANDETRRP
jgi:hypothetical protein